MKKNEDIIVVHLGQRRIGLIEGSRIKKYLPESVVEMVHMALDDRGMKWNDEVIKDCTLIMGYKNDCSVMYKYDFKKFNGLLLFTFNNSPKYEHSFGFPMKGNHLEYYLGGSRY